MGGGHMDKSETPMVDAHFLTFAGVDGMVRYAVHVDFARQLERELSAAKAALARLRREYFVAGGEMSCAEACALIDEAMK